MERMEPTKTEPVHEQARIEMVQSLKGLYDSIKQLDPEVVGAVSAKLGLAFVVEHKYLKTPDSWKDEVGKFNTGALESYAKGGYVDLSWFLSDSVAQEYINFLSERQAVVADDTELVKRIDILKNMAIQSNEFYRKSHENGQAVAITGIPKEYIPEWLKLVE